MIEIYNYADLGGKRSWNYTQEGRTPKDDGIQPIAVTDKEVNMDSILIINNVAYCVCCLSGKGSSPTDRQYHTAYVEKAEIQNVYIMNEEPESQDYTTEITCPYCGYTIDDSWECSDKDDNYECPGCMSHFSYERNVEVTYTSYPKQKKDATII